MHQKFLCTDKILLKYRMDDELLLPLINRLLVYIAILRIFHEINEKKIFYDTQRISQFYIEMTS